MSTYNVNQLRKLLADSPSTKKARLIIKNSPPLMYPSTEVFMYTFENGYLFTEKINVEKIEEDEEFVNIVNY